MKFRKLSNTNEALSAIGLGCMGLNFAYGHQVDQKQSSLLLERAIDLGINFWDTADMYANGANESLISGVLVPNRDKIFIATKFGFRHKNGAAAPAVIQIPISMVRQTMSNRPLKTPLKG
ncbi:aldo/keto reductase [Arachidicoccus ginsenosidivorans]|uniref:aldo/keto reductase n=1 Tax=Arachidicoccus ginsenosidivorans TaxID=496057 RepID=UPI0021D0E998|nr:aldo/keto reductase [Arachidicoccus ginsenosidivorans]